MNFYKYLQNKVFIFESSNNISQKYFFDGKILYPIIGLSYYKKNKKIDLKKTDTGYQNQESGKFLFTSTKSVSIIYYSKKQDQNQSNSSSQTPKYIEDEKVFYPIESPNFYYVSGDKKEFKIDEYTVDTRNIPATNLYVLKNQGSSSGSGGTSEIQDLEAATADVTAEEPPPEETPAEETK